MANDFIGRFKIKQIGASGIEFSKKQKNELWKLCQFFRYCSLIDYAKPVLSGLEQYQFLLIEKPFSVFFSQQQTSATSSSMQLISHMVHSQSNSKKLRRVGDSAKILQFILFKINFSSD